MRKFNITVTQRKEYEVEIDEDKINKKFLDEFEKYFYYLTKEDDRIKSLASDYCRLRATGFSGFIEGYGYVLEDGKIPFEARFHGIEEDDINTGINFKVINEDNEYPGVEVTEII